jgi:DNA-binding Lrp family transcriptional regulator
MGLRPQDVVAALQLAASGQALSYAALAQALEMSPSQTHSAVARAVRAGLVERDTRQVNRRALLEFLVHGVKYVFPAVRGRATRGIPTAHAAPPLAKQIAAAGELPPVWPDPHGPVRGETFMPLHRSAVAAAKRDPKMYELLALVDALRDGRARERRRAQTELEKRLAS